LTVGRDVDSDVCAAGRRQMLGTINDGIPVRFARLVAQPAVPGRLSQSQAKKTGGS
jgi:hypothetical protein